LRLKVFPEFWWTVETRPAGLCVEIRPCNLPAPFVFRGMISGLIRSPDGDRSPRVFSLESRTSTCPAPPPSPDGALQGPDSKRAVQDMRLRPSPAQFGFRQQTPGPEKFVAQEVPPATPCFSCPALNARAFLPGFCVPHPPPPPPPEFSGG